MNEPEEKSINKNRNHSTNPAFGFALNMRKRMFLFRLHFISHYRSFFFLSFFFFFCYMLFSVSSSECLMWQPCDRVPFEMPYALHTLLPFYARHEYVFGKKREIFFPRIYFI